MLKLDELLDLCKSVALNSGQRFLDDSAGSQQSYSFSVENPKEVKAAADRILETEILGRLTPLGLPILSEESGHIPGSEETGYWFVVDPLDGTFNFVKNLGPCAVSIALWQGQTPIFGVIYSLIDRKLFWGGAGIGAFADGKSIFVSNTIERSRASLCTGFPVRFDMEDDHALRSFCRTVRMYSKIRMLGSAAVSLLQVAKGSADVYSEAAIMLWDVAAGLAIVQGAGGDFIASRIGEDWKYRIFASNANLLKHGE
jgi:myo-inositol-1(or 4)-monophosphatase